MSKRYTTCKTEQFPLFFYFEYNCYVEKEVVNRFLGIFSGSSIFNIISYFICDKDLIVNKCESAIIS